MTSSLEIVEIARLRAEVRVLREQLGTDQAKRPAMRITRNQAAAAIAVAVGAAHSAYWHACDTEGRALDPADLDAPKGLLDDAYEASLQVESLAAAQRISWPEAREMG